MIKVPEKNIRGSNNGLARRGSSFVFKFFPFLFAILLAAPSLLAAATPVYQAAGTARSGVGAVSWPAHQVDDVALLFVESAGGQAASLSTPNGFTEVTGSPYFTGAGTAGTRITVFWARATSAAMAAPVVAGPADHAFSVILTFRGVIKNGDPWNAVTGGVKTPASVTLNAAGVTTTVEETLLVLGVANDIDAAKAVASSWVNNSLGGIVERFDDATNTGGGGGLSVMTGTPTVEGATGNTTVTVTSSINAYITLALKRLTPARIDTLAVAARQISAGWPLIAGATGYTLVASRTQANPPDITYSSDTIANSAVVGAPALDANTTHYIYIRSNGPREASEWTFLRATATLVEFQPASPSFGAVTASAIQFNWSNNNNPLNTTGYRVQVSSVATFASPAVVTTSDTFNLSMSSSGLAANTTYYFRVASINHNGVITNNFYTTAAGTSTLLAADPAFNTLAVSTGSVRLDWLHNGNLPGTLYRVLLSGSPTMSPAVSSDTYNNFLSSAGLAANTTYYFSVTGLNHNGVPTNALSVSTATWARAPVSPAFSGLSTGSVRVDWGRDGSPPDTLYRVKVSSLSDLSLFSSSDTYNNYLSSAGIIPNTTYYFSVTGLNRNGIATAPMTASTATWAQAPEFTGFSGLSTGSVRAAWERFENPADTLYRVKVSSLSDLSLYSSSDTYNNYLSSAGLQPNTTYYFSVTGLNRGGLPTAPLAVSTATWARDPAFYSFAPGASAVLFTWTDGGNPSGTLYRVRAALDEAFLDPAATSSDTYNVSLGSAGLVANTTYYFSAAALNHNGVLSNYTVAAGTSTLANTPADLAFTGVAPFSMQLNWGDAGNRPGTLYRVRSSRASDFDNPGGEQVVSSYTYNTFLSTAGLNPMTVYYFEAAAVNNNGVMTAPAYANTATLNVGQMGSPVPGAVSEVHVSSMTATWSLVADATGYTLAASLSPDNPPTVFASSTTVLVQTSTAVFSPPLSPDTVYYLFVRANGLMASSDWSSYPPVSTRVQYNPAYIDFTGVQEDSARFNWDRSGNPADVTAYRVLVSTAPDPLAPGEAVVTSSETYNLFLSSAGLASNTTYYFRVAGINKDGVPTAYTLPVSTATRPRAPAFESFYSVDAAAIEFRWADLNPEGSLHRVRVSTASDFSGAVTSSDTYNEYLSSSGLTANTTYYFSAAVIGHSGVITGYSDAASTATLLAFDPVFDRFVVAGEGAIEFKWTDLNHPTGTLYRVSVSADPGFPVGAVTTSSETYNKYLSSSGLAANTTYYFNAVGVNHNGVPTLYTGVKSTASLANMPGSVVSTFSAVGVAGFTASWDGALNPPGTLYTVRISTAGDFNAGAADGVTASTRPESGLSYSFSGLTSDAVYYFQARAVNYNGVATDYAGLGSTATLALAAPVTDPVSDVGTSSITASWQLVAGATGYTLAASVNPGAEPSPVYTSSVTLGSLGAALYQPALALNTTYYLFVRANGLRRSGAWAVYPATSTLANDPLSAVSTFSGVQFNSFSVSWNNNSNALGSTVYTVQVSSASDFNAGATDGVSFATAPAAGPGAFFDGLNADTYYYFRVRTHHNNGNFTAWKNLGYAKTKALPVIHAPGDGVLLYGNTSMRYRRYEKGANVFSSASEPFPATPGSLFVIKTSPLQTKQEALAGYVKDGTLHLLCTDGSNWYEEWTQAVGGPDTSRRFDIAYEANTGDALVLYSRNASGSGELGYRTRAGGTDCDSGGWSADTPFNPAGTAGIVRWVKLAADRRTSSGTIAAAWSDSASALAAMVWNGTAWQSETAALATTLDFVTAAGDTEVFDIDYESAGDIMLVWGLAVGNNTNGAWYSAAAWSEATQSHTWGAATAMPTFADDATNLDLAANPGGDQMAFASIGKNSSDLQVGYWSGTTWTNTANKDTAAAGPAAGGRLVAAAWVSSGAVTSSVITYNDAAATGISYLVGSGATFGNTVLASPAPAFGNPQKLYSLQQDPVNLDRLVFAVSDINSDLFAKRLEMNAAGTIAWTDAAGGAALETSLASTTVAGYSFAFWPAPPVTLFEQSAYRFFANANSPDVGAPLAAQDALAPLPGAGAAFRLRLALHVSQVDLPVNGQGFRLQFAGKGSGTCEAPSGGTPADYTDVTAATALAFYDNAALADNAPLAANPEDPRHGAHANVDQAYEELNNSTNTVAAILRNQDGLWDFSLRESGAVPGAIYCFRLVKADGSGLNAYSSYPEALLPAPVYVNEVAPAEAAGEDWVEFYNTTSSTFSVEGWNLYYVESTIDLGGSQVGLWTGTAGQFINAYSTYTVTFSTDLKGAQSGHVVLRDAYNNYLDAVQWPALSAGQSFARLVDGGAFFEIDPTPTRNYANFVGTDGFKISEIGAGALTSQFIELYNPAAGPVVSLYGYALRNAASSAAGLTFKFDRKIHPLDYALLDFSSYSSAPLAYESVFGAGGLLAAGDFLTLENSTGSTVNTVTWQSAGNYKRYDHKAALVPFSGGAEANAPVTLARLALAGYDTGDSSDKFSFSALATPASRNDNAGLALDNTLVYPLEQAGAQYLSRQFPLSLSLGASAAAGTGNNLVFSRLPGGSADLHSPHVYRLADLGLDLGSTLEQTAVQYGFSFNDQDGWPLVSSAAYRMVLNSDTGAASAAPAIAASVTYDASVHGVTASTAAPVRMNNATRAAVIKVLVSNNSPAGFNPVQVTTVAFSLLDENLLPTLDTQEARNLFNAVMLVKETAAGLAGVYEPAVDVTTVAYVPMADITLDPAGLSTLTVSAAYLPSAAVAAASTGTFYVVLESTQDAAAWTPSVFRVRLSPADASVRDASAGLLQDSLPGGTTETPLITLMVPAAAPIGTSWPFALPAGAAVETPAAFYTNDGDTAVSSAVYVAATDGYLRARKKDGSLKWSYPPAAAAPIRTAPNVRKEGAAVYIYFAADDGTVYKVQDNGDSASEAWTVNFPGVKVSSGIIDVDTDPVLYFGGSTAANAHAIYCLNKSDGSGCGPGWPFSVPARVSGQMVLDSRATINTAWIGLESGVMMSLQTVELQSPTSLDTVLPIRSSPLLDARIASLNNLLYFTSTNGILYARVSSNFAMPDGWTDYTYAAGTPINTSPFMTFYGTKYIYFGDDLGRLHKVDAATGAGEPGWPFQAGGAIRSSPVWLPDSAAFPQGGADYVYFGCDDGYIYAINAVTGAHRQGWPVATGGAVRTDIVADPDAGTIIAESGDGKTYVLKISQ